MGQSDKMIARNIMKWVFVLVALARTLVASQNVFVHPHYVQPEWRDRVLSMSNVSQSVQFMVANTATAYWIDTKAKLGGFETVLRNAAAQQPPQLVVFVVYNLPNRDCAAMASSGEICCARKRDGTCDYSAKQCTSGLDEYRRNYIDPIAQRVKTFAGRVPMAAILEPDSLANVVTNLDNVACANSQQVYRDGITYAVSKLSTAGGSALALYLDAAHGGWLGWDSNAQGFQALVSSLNILPKLRGFALNVANYQPLGEACPSARYCRMDSPSQLSHPCCVDPCGLVPQWNDCPTEIAYAQKLATLFPGKKMVIDTSRNGAAHQRKQCSMWCNPRNMGLGPPSQAVSSDFLDAYFWIKVPGESDGCTVQLPSGEACSRFDRMCASEEAIGSRVGEPRAPDAGQWFSWQMQMLINNYRPSQVSTQPAPPTFAPPSTCTAYICNQCTCRSG